MSEVQNPSAKLAEQGVALAEQKWLLLVLTLLGLLLCGCGASKADALDPAATAEGPQQELVWRGVPLGEFHIQHMRPLENLKLVLSFDLTASVGETNEAYLVKLVAARKHRLRDQVIVAVRAAPTVVFDEPELVELRRRIHLRVQEVLEGSEIADIYLTNFDCQVD